MGIEPVDREEIGHKKYNSENWSIISEKNDRRAPRRSSLEILRHSGKATTRRPLRPLSLDIGHPHPREKPLQPSRIDLNLVLKKNCLNTV